MSKKFFCKFLVPSFAAVMLLSVLVVGEAWADPASIEAVKSGTWTGWQVGVPLPADASAPAVKYTLDAGDDAGAAFQKAIDLNLFKISNLPVGLIQTVERSSGTEIDLTISGTPAKAVTAPLALSFPASIPHGAGNANISEVSAAVDVTVNGAPVSIEIAKGDPAVTFDGGNYKKRLASLTLAATVSPAGVGAVRYSVTGGDAQSKAEIVETAKLKVTGGLAGETVIVTASVEETDDYSPASATATFTVVEPELYADLNQVVFNGTTRVYTGDTIQMGAISVVDSARFAGGESGAFIRTYTYTGVSPAVYPESAVPPVNAGTYWVKGRIESVSYYAEKVDTLKIAPKSIANLTFTLGASSLSYNGWAQTPGFVIKDGDNALVEVTDYIGVFDAGSPYFSNKDAGTALVRVAGQGNYADTLRGSFTITRAPLTLNPLASTIPSKVYDGSNAVDTAGMGIRFDGLQNGEALGNVKDFAISKAQYGSTNVAANTSVSAMVALVANGPVAKNYSLASGSFSRPADGGPAIAIVSDLDTSHFTFTIPGDHLYTGTARGLAANAVAFKSGRINGGAISITYDGVDDKDTVCPVDTGTYSVYARITGGTNYAPGSVKLGDYTIGRQLRPDVNSVTPASLDTTVRNGDALTLSIDAVSPNGGTLTYQWYKVVDGAESAVSGATAKTYAPSTLVEGTFTYLVWVTNSRAGYQIPDSVQAGPFTVKVLPPAKSIRNAVISIGDADGFVYDGEAKTPVDITVTLEEVQLSGASDYQIRYVNNVNAGDAIVTVAGIGGYRDEATATFTIAKSELAAEDLSYAATRYYNGGEQPVTVSATRGRTGLGAVTATYNGEADVPVNAGTYEVVVSVAEGQNFFALDSAAALGTYRILQKPALDTGDVTFKIPTGHKATGKPQGIGEVTVRGTDFGEASVLYNDEADLPIDIGEYEVKVKITGGANYAASSLVLGTYTIADTAEVSVASSDRVIPGSGSQQSVVAPVGVAAGEFAVGPNPVAKASGSVSLFWQGKAVASGTLFVFDASGNLVKKVAVADRGVSADRREIGSWNLADAKGRPVAEGTYLVKGALVAKDGSKVKVSAVVGVK